MAPHLLRVTAQNLSPTVFDTNDLSTIRGGGMALLDRVSGLDEQRLAEAAGVGAKVDIVSSGASELLARIEPGEGFQADDYVATVRVLLSKVGPERVPAELFCFAVACRPMGKMTFPQAVAAIETDVRVAQYRTLSFPLPVEEPKASRPCSLNGRLPISPGKTVKKKPVAASVAARHIFGREQRSRFYADLLAGTDVGGRLAAGGYGFTDSLADLTADRSDKLDLPIALSGKIALLMLDGNGFQARRNTLVSGPGGAAAVAKFSTFVSARQRRLLAAIVDYALGHRHMKTTVASDDGAAERLRLETILWGGDELLFALPVWAAWDIALIVMRELEGWVLPTEDFPGLGDADRRLTHGVGLVFANHKTPIRQMRNLVDELVYASKAAGKARNNLSAFAFESVDLPLGGLTAARNALFFGDAAAGAIDLTISADGAGFAEATRRLEALRAVLPRSQAMKRALAARDGPGGLLEANRAAGAGSWAAETRDELARVLRSRDVATATDLLGLGRDPKATPFVTAEKKAALPLLHALHLWDYVRPFGPDSGQSDARV